MTNAESVVEKMIEVEIDSGDDFRKIKETLTRMGVPAKNDKKLFQSVHILQKRGYYYLCHFKELFLLDGRESTISTGDIARRNRIAKMLQDWELVKIKDESKLEPMGKPSMVKVIKHSEVSEWELSAKYAIGTKKRREVNNNG